MHLTLMEKGIPTSGKSTKTQLPLLALLRYSTILAKLASPSAPLNNPPGFEHDKSNGLDRSKDSAALTQSTSGTPSYSKLRKAATTASVLLLKDYVSTSYFSAGSNLEKAASASLQFLGAKISTCFNYTFGSGESATILTLKLLFGLISAFTKRPFTLTHWPVLKKTGFFIPFLT